MKRIQKNIHFIQSIAVASSLALVLCGCGPKQTVFADSGSSAGKPIVAMAGYVNIGTLPYSADKISEIKYNALRETASELGARGALAWRSLQINRSLTMQQEYLDHAFDFNQLLLPHNVLPPVLAEADNSIVQPDQVTIRLESKTYTLLSNARFVTTPPTWRTYLWMNYPKPDLPDHTLLPTTQAEAVVWNFYIKQGWKAGLIQANAIFSINLNRLKRDYQGIILYRKLYAENMVSAPFVASTDLGVTGDASQININDRVLRITALSQMQTNSKTWNPVIVKPQP